MSYQKPLIAFSLALALFGAVSIRNAMEKQGKGAPAGEVRIKASGDNGKPGWRPDYSHSLWLNGWRRNSDATSPAVLAVESKHYDFALRPADLGKVLFIRKEKSEAYLETLQMDSNRFEAPGNSEFVIELQQGGKTYRAVNCRAGESARSRLGSARMWESGRYVQHYELLGLNFQDSDGKKLPCEGSLDLVAWPDSLAFNAMIAPAGAAWENASLRISLAGTEVHGEAKKTFEGSWTAGEQKTLTLSVPCAPRANEQAQVSLQVTCSGSQVIPVTFDPRKNCYVAAVEKLKRTPREDYVGSTRGYDDFLITIDNQEKQDRDLPFLLDVRNPANITGLCPLLCDKSGRPNGLPVQLSKNWHKGSYFMGYTRLPVKPGRSEYLFRIVYGFYGTLPSASHAQLSIVGYTRSDAGNGRWDQLAIGSWGETFCFDMDMSLTNVAICDVRMLMARNGLNGAKWGWTDAGWGGDWLGMKNSLGEKLAFNGMKTAYLSHGPCLTDVRYTGFYGAKREVSLEAEVHTLRTDDYARTFQKLKYTFNTATKTEGLWLYKMGGTPTLVTPKVAYGNRDGLISELATPPSMKEGDLFLKETPLTGNGPWWVAFPGAVHIKGRDWGTGYRALVIRSYKARVAGRTFDKPRISLPVQCVYPDAKGVNVNCHMVAPEGVAEFQPKDTVEMDVEWITLPKVTDDYYGPNEAFRRHVADNPASWKTTHREAIGNDLKVVAKGGQVLDRYPIVIRTEALPVTVDIDGGVGFVPIRFSGLKSQEVTLFEVKEGKELKLDQSAKGNDFWQVDYDDASGCYSVVYNLPMEKNPRSTWVLKEN